VSAEPVRLEAMARALIELARDLEASDPRPTPFLVHKGPNLGRIAQAMYRERGQRASYFPDGLFAEPSWDILLDLFVASRENALRSVKEVCIASHAADATALRHVETLIAAGLVVRTRDTRDNRRKFLALSPEGYRRMSRFLAAVAEGEGEIQTARRFAARG
jgi:DNA-binding MarR family transcriptional regulator